MPATWQEYGGHRRPARPGRPVQPAGRDLLRRALPGRQRRQARPAQAQSSPTTTPPGTSTRCWGEPTMASPKAATRPRTLEARRDARDGPAAERRPTSGAADTRAGHPHRATTAQASFPPCCTPPATSAPQTIATLPSSRVSSPAPAGGDDLRPHRCRYAGHVIIDLNGTFYESGGSAFGGGGAGVKRIRQPPAAYLVTFDRMLHPAGM